MKFVDSVVGDIGKIRVLWKEWNIRSFILASFAFQLFLIFFAPFRKRSSSYVIIASTWLSYLLADWVAAQAVGLITRATEITYAENELFALWAQFLLVHLGGPDTITALALEDNALWLRTGLHLGTQAYSTLGILVRSIRRSRLWAPMVLMFVAGVIKYVERIMSLFHGRMMDIDEDPTPYLDSLALDESKEELSEVDMVRGGFNLFHCYKRLYADRKLNPELRKAVRMYATGRRSSEAYRIVEVQLNFMYEAMYTKASVSHKTAWRILRHLVLLLELANLVIWFRRAGHNYSDEDIRITDALVIGAVAVDCLALLRIQMSDWSIARIDEHSGRIRTRLCNQLLSARQSGYWMWSFFNRVFFARWSETILKLEDVSSIFYPLMEVATHSHLDYILIGLFFLEKEGFSSELWDFIYEVLTKPLSGSGREYELHTGETIDIDTLLARALPLDVLDDNQAFRMTSSMMKSQEKTPDCSGTANNDIKRCWRVCHTIQRYLAYLYYLQPEMMYGALGKHNVLDSLEVQEMQSKIRPKTKEMLSKTVMYRGKKVDGDGRKEFGILTREFESDKSEERVTAMRQIEEVRDFVSEHLHDEEEKWYLIAVLWVQLLCHTAITCRPNVHARRLKEGGELISFVWLLMMHLGIRTKLRVPSFS